MSAQVSRNVLAPEPTPSAPRLFLFNVIIFSPFVIIGGGVLAALFFLTSQNPDASRVVNSLMPVENWDNGAPPYVLYAVTSMIIAFATLFCSLLFCGSYYFNFSKFTKPIQALWILFGLTIIVFFGINAVKAFTVDEGLTPAQAWAMQEYGYVLLEETTENQRNIFVQDSDGNEKDVEIIRSNGHITLSE